MSIIETLKSTFSRWGWGWTFVVAVTLGLFACQTVPTTKPQTGPRVVDAAARFAQTAAAMTGQKAQLADEFEGGRHVGFDTHTYPGLKIMKVWKETPGSPYKWVGFYLPAPCHNDTSWVGKREEIDSLGWGVAVVYVGQQTWGRTPRTLTPLQRQRTRARNDCNADLLSAAEGRDNADDATRAAAAEGFDKGIVVFLDIERMETIPIQMRDYYRAWVARMIELGQYRPGIYTHQHNAAEIFSDVNAVFKSKGVNETPRFWIAGGKGFDQGRAPQDVGFAFAGIWQGLIDVARSIGQVRLPVDINVATWASPSETGVTE
jgi:hypothetical protein